jgi:hypothetical protein
MQIIRDPEMLRRDRPSEQDITCGDEAGPLQLDARHDTRSTWALANETLAPAGVSLSVARRGVLAKKEPARRSGCFAKDEVGVTAVLSHLGMCGKSRRARTPRPCSALRAATRKS